VRSVIAAVQALERFGPLPPVQHNIAYQAITYASVCTGAATSVHDPHFPSPSPPPTHWCRTMVFGSAAWFAIICCMRTAWLPWRHWAISFMQAGLGIHCFARFAWDENYGCVRGGVLVDKCFADITLALLFFQIIFGACRARRKGDGGCARHSLVASVSLVR